MYVEFETQKRIEIELFYSFALLAAIRTNQSVTIGSILFYVYIFKAIQ